MGAVRFSIDTKLIEELKRHLPLQVLVETGTFQGDTVAQVRSLFHVVHTVDLSEKYYEHARRRFEKDEAVHVRIGHSPDFIAQLVPGLADRSVLFWLDAHWCAAEGTAGETSQCPLLDELRGIGRLNTQSVILIDDARFFLCPPPSPHEVSEWPSFDDVLRTLRALSRDHRLMVLNDVLIFFPLQLERALGEFAHRNAIDWLSVMDKSRDYDNILTQFGNLDQEARRLDEEVRRKEAEIVRLAGICSERLELIQTQSAEIDGLRALVKSTAYRLGFCLVNPLVAAKKLIAALFLARRPPSEGSGPGSSSG